MTDPRAHPPIGEDDLQAFVDERLDAARLALVRRYLEEHPEAAARVRAFATQRDALRTALAPKASAPIPARLRLAHIRAGLRARRWQRLRHMAAALLLLLVGGAAGWLAHGQIEGGAPPPAAPPMAEAAEAHRIFAAETRALAMLAATVPEALEGWLAERLGTPVVVPDLLDAGFRPLTAHLMPSAWGTAAMVVYERLTDGTRLSFYMRPAPDTPAAKLKCADHPGGRLTYYWFDGRFGYAVTAAMPRERLRGIAFLAEREVRAGPRPPRQEGPRIAAQQPRPCPNNIG
ncbi:anti-sigma factor family protein [Crenalkalicoccus roseus]|uniref:anti-sigma factor family protein n=1 Tax=Crenalkalicoccus roseus TaxID=1485588 RepID=UPI0019566D6D|nr:anti-sigma factor [Crenalkalicoccus roseus]